MRMGLLVVVVVACSGCGKDKSSPSPTGSASIVSPVGSSVGADAAPAVDAALVVDDAESKRVYDALVVDSAKHEPLRNAPGITGITKLAPQRVEVWVAPGTDSTLAKGFCRIFVVPSATCEASARPTRVSLELVRTGSRATVQIRGELRYGTGGEAMSNFSTVVVSWDTAFDRHPALVEAIGRRAGHEWLLAAESEIRNVAAKYQDLANVVQWHARPGIELLSSTKPKRDGKPLHASRNVTHLLVDSAGHVWTLVLDGSKTGLNVATLARLDDATGAIGPTVQWFEHDPLGDGQHVSVDRDALLVAVQGLESVDGDTVFPTTRGDAKAVYVFALANGKASILAHLPNAVRLAAPTRGDDGRLYVIARSREPGGSSARDAELLQIDKGVVVRKWAIPESYALQVSRCTSTWMSKTHLIVRCFNRAHVVDTTRDKLVTTIDVPAEVGPEGLQATAIPDGTGAVIARGMDVVRLVPVTGEGKAPWRTRTLGASRLALAGGRVIGYGDRGIYVLDLASGKELATDSSTKADAIAAVDRDTFLVCFWGELVAFHKHERWKRVPFAATTRCQDLRVRADRSVIVSTYDEVFALEPIGSWPDAKVDTE